MQKAPEGAHVYYYQPINSLEACPDYTATPYLKDGNTLLVNSIFLHFN